MLSTDHLHASAFHNNRSTTFNTDNETIWVTHHSVSCRNGFLGFNVNRMPCRYGNQSDIVVIV